MGVYFQSCLFSWLLVGRELAILVWWGGVWCGPKGIDMLLLVVVMVSTEREKEKRQCLFWLTVATAEQQPNTNVQTCMDACILLKLTVVVRSTTKQECVRGGEGQAAQCRKQCGPGQRSVALRGSKTEVGMQEKVVYFHDR